MYVSNDASNPIERLSLYDVNMDVSTVEWETLVIGNGNGNNSYTMTDLVCPDGSTYQWLSGNLISQAGMFINSEMFYLYGGYRADGSQILQVNTNSDFPNVTGECINTTFENYQIQSAVK